MEIDPNLVSRLIALLENLAMNPILDDDDRTMLDMLLTELRSTEDAHWED